MEPGDLGARLDAQLRVEVGQRLVHEEDGRLAHDRAAERDALALAAGQLLRLAVEELAELGRLGRLVDAALDLGLGELAQLQAEGEVVADRHVRVERVALEDHRDVAVLGGDVVHDAIADLERARGDFLEPGDHPQGGRLAAARGADQDHELAVLDLEVHVLDDLDGTEALDHVVERHACHGGTSSRGPMAARVHASGRRERRTRTDPVRAAGVRERPA